jgi:hypothetical protein
LDYNPPSYYASLRWDDRHNHTQFVGWGGVSLTFSWG